MGKSLLAHVLLVSMFVFNVWFGLAVLAHHQWQSDVIMSKMLCGEKKGK